MSKDVHMSCIPNDNRRIQPELHQIHNKDVTVTKIKNMLFDEECEYIMAYGEYEGLRPSTVIGKNGDRIIDTRRTSNTAFLPKGKDKVLDCIADRFATYAGLPKTHMEPMQVTEYTHKKRYSSHHDYFNQKGGPERTTTMFAYLKSDMLEDGNCGGATSFHNLKQEDGSKLRIYPKRGDVVLWSNRTYDGGLNAETLHSGESVTCTNARKVGMNVWFRDCEWV